MQDKSLVTLVYALLGICLGLLPLLPRLSQQARTALDSVWDEYFDYAFLLLTLLVVADGSVDPSLIGVMVLGALAAGFGQGLRTPGPMLGMATGLLLSCTLIWWRRVPGQAVLSLGNGELIMFVLFASIAWFGLRALAAGGAASTLAAQAPAASTPAGAAPAQPQTRMAPAALRQHWPYALFLPVCGVLFFTTASLQQPLTRVTSWHHWGAYIGPAELLRSGAHILSDFPAQYGLGPTLLVAGACGNDCWSGMYWLVGLLGLAGAALLGALALQLPGVQRSVLSSAAVLALMLACAVFWTGLPLALVSPLVFPSVGGLRYVPVLVMVLLAVRAARHDQPLPWAGHLAWALGCLWSVESAFIATFVWWPLALAFTATQSKVSGPELLRALVATGLRLLAQLAGLLALSAGVYYGVYGELPTRIGVLAYALYPPGPLPIVPTGAVLFGAGVLALGTAVLVQLMRGRQGSAALRMHFTFLLLGYATFSYFALGRSHDNNVLNLSPFLLLLALSSLTFAARVEWRQAALGLAISFAAWLSVFGWGGWVQAIENGSLWRFGPQASVTRFTFDDPATAQGLLANYGRMSSDPKDIQQVLTVVGALRKGPATLLATSMVLPRAHPDQVWNALHAIENFAYLPSPVRQAFLQRTAQRLQRCGWVVVDGRYSDGFQDYPSKVEWLTDYDAVYEMDQQLQVGEVHAFHMRPRGLASCPVSSAAPPAPG